MNETAPGGLESGVQRIRRRTSALYRAVGPTEWILILSVVAFTTLFSAYLFAKFDFYRTGYYDFGSAIQLVWLASRGQETAYVLGRPILLIVAGVATVVPVADALIVTETGLLALGAIPLYLIASSVLKDKWYALLLALVYLVFPALTGVVQYEFHDLSLSIPFLLFMYYYYTKRNFWLFGIFAGLALSTSEYIVVVLAFFIVSLLIEYFSTTRPSVLIKFVAGLAVLLIAWTAYLQITPDLANFAISNVSGTSYTFTGSTSFLNPVLVLENLPYSFQYDLGAKDLYLALLLAPLIFTPLLSLRWLLPSVPWLLLIVFWSPLLGQGGLGPPYVIWSQWSSFVLPFLFIAAVYGFDRLASGLSTRGSSQRVNRRRAATLMTVAVLVVVLSASAFSPFLPQSTLSSGDTLVPNDTPLGEVPHAVWPTPVANLSLLNRFVALVPGHDSVLTQNVLGSRLAERSAPIVIFGQPGWNLAFLEKDPMQVIIVDTQLPDMTPYLSELGQVLGADNYTLSLAYPSAGIYLYEISG